MNCTTQVKYIVYASCRHCLKGSLVDRNGYSCSIHQWYVPTNRFALRIPLSDWEAAEVWACFFDELTTKVLGFDANTYTGMTSGADRYAALS